MDQEEVAIIRKAQRGDCVAFETLIRKYDGHILNLALDMVGDIEDAKDIYQEVLIRAFRSLPKFRFQSELFTWLYRITVNYTINFRKKKSHRAAYYVDSQHIDFEKQPTMDSQVLSTPDQDMERKDFREHLYRSLDLLSPKQRSVFVLRHFHGHKLAEIAIIMDCKLGTVKNYLFRATQKVRHYLEALEKA